MATSQKISSLCKNERICTLRGEERAPVAPLGSVNEYVKEEDT